ncbi:MAG: F0F1 ATP synthase subunit alpha, partial [Patescibacteria group bacterium]
NGYLDDIAVDQVAKFSADLLEDLETSGRKILKQITEEKKLTEEAEKILKKFTAEFKLRWQGK